MSNKKHIDRLFQEKFKDFEAKPSDAVWQNIQKQLNQPKQAVKPIVPLWSKWAAVAAVILIFVSVGINLFTNNTLNLNNSNTDGNIEEEVTRSTTKSSTTDTVTSTKAIENKDSFSSTSSKNVNTILDSTSQVTYSLSLEDSKVSKNYNAKDPNLKDSQAVTQTHTVNNNSSLENSNLDSKRNEAQSGIQTPLKGTQNTVDGNSSNGKQKYNDQQKNSNNGNASAKNSNIVSTSSTTNLGNQSKSKSKSEDKNRSNTTVASNSKEKNTILYSNTSKNNQIAKNNTSELFNINKQLKALASTNLAQNQTIIDNPILDSSIGESIEDAIAKLKKLDEKEKENTLNKWSVNANIAPVYYNSLGKGSSIDEQFINNEKDGELNMSYGVQVGYALNDKLKIRSGINKLKLSYDTAGVVVYQSVSTGTPDIKPLRHIDFETAPNGESLSVLSAENFNVQQINSVFNDKFNAALSQRMSYIEVPLELEYAIINNRFGLNIIGGMSTFFLSDNQVVTEFDNYKTKIGEANNINDVSFSTNLGLGLDYNFSKTFTFNFEPTFKYQINTYSESSGNFKPYIIGVYTGFSYTF